MALERAAAWHAHARALVPRVLCTHASWCDAMWSRVGVNARFEDGGKATLTQSDLTQPCLPVSHRAASSHAPLRMRHARRAGRASRSTFRARRRHMACVPCA